MNILNNMDKTIVDADQVKSKNTLSDTPYLWTLNYLMLNLGILKRYGNYEENLFSDCCKMMV